MIELLTPKQMGAADRHTIDAGTPGITLMDAAGAAVVDCVGEQFQDAEKLLIVCGTGNNGGDGFVAARLLHEQGLLAQILICGDPSKIAGDAALAYEALDKTCLLDRVPDTEGYDLIIDALIGAGLEREVTGAFADIIQVINAADCPVLAVDLPSGIDGRTGKAMGAAVEATATVTFFRYKPGHILLPGRSYCGSQHLYQIGIEEPALIASGVEAHLNTPDLWEDALPVPGLAGHKYNRGHTLVVSGPPHATGAARLVAGAALRAGSGLVTLATSSEALPINAAHLTAIMLKVTDSVDDIAHLLKDRRFNCLALGPGLEPDEQTRSLTLKLLSFCRQTILDAGALTAFSETPELLFAAIGSATQETILTPHTGEFVRLFHEHAVHASKIDRAKSAARQSGAVIVLKGPDTVIASPDGRAAVSDNGPPWLATAGSGDVLAGVVAGLAAQGMPAFEAACAAVWLHGDAARRTGPGLISTDLDEGLRQSIAAIFGAGD